MNPYILQYVDHIPDENAFEIRGKMSCDPWRFFD